MREIVVLIPEIEPDQNVEIEVSINGKKQTIHYKVELLNWEMNEVPPKEKVTVLKHYIEKKEKSWELIEIGAPDNGNIPLMFRKKQEF